MSTFLDAQLRDFANLWNQGLDRVVSAAEVYCNAVQVCGDEAKKAFQSRFPQFSTPVWGELERVGKGMLLPEIMLGLCGHASNALSYLPIEQQKNVTTNGVIVVCGARVVHMGVKELTYDQVRQVFYRGSVRSVAEQRAWLQTRCEKKIRKTAREAIGPDFKEITILKGAVSIYRGTSLPALVLSAEQLVSLARKCLAKSKDA